MKSLQCTCHTQCGTLQLWPCSCLPLQHWPSWPGASFLLPGICPWVPPKASPSKHSPQSLLSHSHTTASLRISAKEVLHIPEPAIPTFLWYTSISQNVAEAIFKDISETISDMALIKHPSQHRHYWLFSLLNLRWYLQSDWLSWIVLVSVHSWLSHLIFCLNTYNSMFNG